MNTTQKPIILIIDDETAILSTLQQALQDEDYRVQTLNQGHKALETIGKLVPDLVLLDIFMPNSNGIDVLKQIKKEYPQQKVMMISGFGNIPLAIQALKNGAIDFIEKPLNLDEILSKIAFLQEQETTFIPSTHNKATEEIIGKSYTFVELVRQSEKIAPYNFPVIIYGQSGTGKTTIARHIHNSSDNAQTEFITIKCSHEQEEEQRKSLTQSFKKEKITLYLKHIDLLSTENQKYLLTLIDKNKEKKLRLIVSSCTSLFSLTQRNLFNPTLFYKLNVIPLEIPPLYKHQYDVPLLVDHFLDKANKKTEKKIVFSTATIRQLRNASWPGNIEELKNAVFKIVSIAPEINHVITPNDLASYLGERNIQVVEEQSFASFSNLKEATHSFEKNFLLYLLKKNHYNLEQVSDHLNMSTPQLKNKLLELKIETKN